MHRIVFTFEKKQLSLVKWVNSRDTADLRALWMCVCVDNERLSFGSWKYVIDFWGIIDFMVTCAASKIIPWFSFSALPNRHWIVCFITTNKLGAGHLDVAIIFVSPLTDVYIITKTEYSALHVLSLASLISTQQWHLGLTALFYSLIWFCPFFIPTSLIEQRMHLFWSETPVLHCDVQCQQLLCIRSGTNKLLVVELVDQTIHGLLFFYFFSREDSLDLSFVPKRSNCSAKQCCRSPKIIEQPSLWLSLILGAPNEKASG